MDGIGCPSPDLLIFELDRIRRIPRLGVVSTHESDQEAPIPARTLTSRVAVLQIRANGPPLKGEESAAFENPA